MSFFAFAIYFWCVVATFAFVAPFVALALECVIALVSSWMWESRQAAAHSYRGQHLH